MRWNSRVLPSGTWIWWARFDLGTAWIIDDAASRGRGTEYHIAASQRTVTLFSQQRISKFREAKAAALAMLIETQLRPLQVKGQHFASNRRQ
jgi:hypothetical protein